MTQKLLNHDQKNKLVINTIHNTSLSKNIGSARINVAYTDLHLEQTDPSLKKDRLVIQNFISKKI
jgi:hypothetical protein